MYRTAFVVLDSRSAVLIIDCRKNGTCVRAMRQQKRWLLYRWNTQLREACRVCILSCTDGWTIFLFHFSVLYCPVYREGSCQSEVIYQRAGGNARDGCGGERVSSTMSSAGLCVMQWILVCYEWLHTVLPALVLMYWSVLKWGKGWRLMTAEHSQHGRPGNIDTEWCLAHRVRELDRHFETRPAYLILESGHESSGLVSHQTFIWM